MAKHKNLHGSRHGQHSVVCFELNRMRRKAMALAEQSVAEAWEGPAITFAHDLWAMLEEAYYQAERLEDQGQIPMFR